MEPNSNLDDKVRWRKGEPYIRMCPSGSKFFLRNPKPESFRRLRDFAFHLAGVNRYTGGSRFSVAAHMCVGAEMARRFYPNETLLPDRFLIHDMPEGAYNDLSSPLKSINPDYGAMLKDAELAVEQLVDLTFLGDPLVKELDTRMWLTERLWVYRHSDVDSSEDYAGPLEPFPLTRIELADYFGDGQYIDKFWEQEWYEQMLISFPEVEWVV